MAFYKRLETGCAELREFPVRITKHGVNFSAVHSRRIEPGKLIMNRRTFGEEENEVALFDGRLAPAANRALTEYGCRDET